MLEGCGECEVTCRDGYCTKPRRVLPKTYADIIPCGDGGCMLRKPIGMHTNGGCGCRQGLAWKGAHDYPHGALAECFAIISAMRDEVATLERTRSEEWEQSAGLENENARLRAALDEALRIADKWEVPAFIARILAIAEGDK